MGVKWIGKMKRSLVCLKRGDALAALAVLLVCSTCAALDVPEEFDVSS